MTIITTKTQTKTTLQATIAASLMVAISSTALLVTWGMMAAVGFTNLSNYQGEGQINIIQNQPIADEQYGYIVIIPGESLIRQTVRLQKSKQTGTLTPEVLQAKVSEYRQQLQQEYFDFEFQIMSRLTKERKEQDWQKLKNQIVLKVFNQSIHAAVLNITEREAAVLRREGLTLFPNRRHELLLSDAVPLVQADRTWQLSDDRGQPVTGENIKIGIIDTGIEWGHPDLGGCTDTEFLEGRCAKVVGGYDFSNEFYYRVIRGADEETVRRNSQYPCCNGTHGTHVASIAAGTGVSAEELKGIAPAALLYSYQVFPFAFESVIIAAVERSIDPNQDGDITDHLDVINLSLGANGSPDDPLSRSVDAAVEAGVVVVVAAGNSGPSGNEQCVPLVGDLPSNFFEDADTICSPGTARNAITVGASYKVGALAGHPTGFSSRGPVVWQQNGVVQHYLKPDLLGPGKDICAAYYAPFLGQFSPPVLCSDDDNYHTVLSGTSMAAPMVTGAVALVKQKHPEWTPAQIKQALKNSAHPYGTERTEIQGYGLLDVLAAVLSPMPPLAILSKATFFEGRLVVEGTVAAENLSHYELYIRRASSSLEPVHLYRSEIAVNDGQLYSGTFNPRQFEAAGLYYVTLVVVDRENVMSEDTITLVYEPFQLLGPNDYSFYRSGEVVEVEGSINVSDYHYSVHYAREDRPEEWLNDGISLDIAGSIIARWDTSQIRDSSFYRLRVRVEYSDGVVERIIERVLIDSDIKQGWPVRFPYEFDFSGSLVAVGDFVPVIVDLDNDGSDNVVVYKNGIPPKLYAYDHGGNLLSHFPVMVGPLQSDQVTTWPVAGDIDNNGFAEIVAFRGRYSDARCTDPVTPVFPAAYVYDYSRNTVREYPLGLAVNADPTESTDCAFDFKNWISLGDISGDGSLELAVNSPKGFAVRRLDGGANPENPSSPTSPSDWSLDWPTVSALFGTVYPPLYNLGGPAAIGQMGPYGRVDNGDLEIAINNNAFGEFIMYSHSGTASRFSAWWSAGPPVIADLDNDGEQEIVRSSFIFASPGPRFFGLRAHHTSGAVPGPVVWEALQGKNSWTSPAVGDFEGDGRLETVISSETTEVFQTYLVDSQGRLLPGWPQSTCAPTLYSPVIGDVSDDGIPDIVVSTSSENCAIYAWDSAGNLVPGFPKKTLAGLSSPPALVDLEQDGKVDLIAASKGGSQGNDHYLHEGMIYVWGLESTYYPASMYWPQYGHDPGHTSFYAPPPTKSFLRGDANQDGNLNISDPIFILNFLFIDNTIPPLCMDAADANDDGTLNITDARYLLNYLFLGNSPAPPTPGPITAGTDLTADDLGC